MTSIAPPPPATSQQKREITAMYSIIKVRFTVPVAVIRQLTTISFQTTILKAHQEFGVASIRAYSTLDREEMETDPKIPDPPTYMKLHGREALPRFTAQSLG